MTLDYTTSGEVKIYMKEYIDKITEEFPHAEEVKNMKIVKTPSAEYLFMVNTNTTKMDADKAYVFHTTIDKSSFLLKREIPDIQLTVLFLCTRVKRLDEYYWKFLLRMMKYPQ